MNCHLWTTSIRSIHCDAPLAANQRRPAPQAVTENSEVEQTPHISFLVPALSAGLWTLLLWPMLQYLRCLPRPDQLHSMLWLHLSSSLQYGNMTTNGMAKRGQVGGGWVGTYLSKRRRCAIFSSLLLCFLVLLLLLKQECSDHFRRKPNRSFCIFIYKSCCCCC